jgi:hypothetical protein
MMTRAHRRILTSAVLLALGVLTRAAGVTGGPLVGVASAQSAEAVVRPAAANFLTGTYREVESRDLELGRRALAATAHLDGEERRGRARALFRLLHAPPVFAIEQYGTTFTLNIPGAVRAPYEADGRARLFRATGGETVSARARLSGRTLTVELTWSGGERLIMSYEVSADSNTIIYKRAVADGALARPVEVISEYRRVATKATRTFAGYEIP